MEENKLPRIAITHGDTNGIGYEVILKMLSDDRILELCTPVLFGSAKAMTFYTKLLGLEPVKYNRIDTADEIADGEVNLIDVCGDIEIEPGQATESSGQAAFKSLEAAVKAVVEEKADALLTAPIDKHAIQSPTFTFAGHTEYLQAVTGADSSLMILFNEDVKVALVTTHLPLSQVAAEVTKEHILEKLRCLNNSLKADFGIVQPRIAVLALNPHAGDGGLLGSEETEVIAPALADAAEEKILCFGPYSADGFFGAELYRRFDGVLAMYHDQGLAPFKAIAMDSGVNFTAGLPIVRTSPDHGTGADIAGRGVASEESMRSALYAAIDIWRNRARHSERIANPLRRHYFDRSKDNVVLDLK